MLKVYGAPISPYCRKLQLALTYRNIPYELVFTRPGDEDASFREASPLGKIPAVRTSDNIAFADSSVIIAFLEKTHEGNSLYPQKPADFAKALFLEELADTKLSEATSALYFQTVLSPTIYGKSADEARVNELKKEIIPSALAKLEELIDDSEYLVGDSWSVADISVGAMLINLWHADFAIDASWYPSVAAFFVRFLERAEVQAQLESEKQTLAHIAAQNNQ